jgi:hypothetical protein
MVMVTLDHMAAGGICDQIGGGFHRYSVDAAWLVPHFEKMLYDNALLAGCYLEAWQATKRPDYARVARATLDYVLRDLTHPRGGFMSAEDADSDGEEGKFYLWTLGELQEVLGPERAQTFSAVYGVTEGGNFEGRNILHLAREEKGDSPHLCDDHASMVPASGPFRQMGTGYPLGAFFRPGVTQSQLEAELEEDRAQLLAARARRVRPARDEKILTSWNGLMVEAMARAGMLLHDSRLLDAATAAADFLLGNLRRADGRLLRYWRLGQARQDAFLDDYASLANALATLHEAQPSSRWLAEAVRLADAVLDRFADRTRGGFFYTPADGEPLVARKKDFLDTPVPSASGLAVTALLRLSRLAHRDEYRRVAEEALRSCVARIQEAPTACGQLLLALDMFIHDDLPQAA